MLTLWLINVGAYVRRSVRVTRWLPIDSVVWHCRALDNEMASWYRIQVPLYHRLGFVAWTFGAAGWDRFAVWPSKVKRREREL